MRTLDGMKAVETLRDMKFCAEYMRDGWVRETESPLPEGRDLVVRLLSIENLITGLGTALDALDALNEEINGGDGDA